MIAVGQEHAISQEPLLAGTTLRPELASRLSFDEELHVMRNLVLLCDDAPGLGVEVACRIGFSSLGPLALTLLACGTARQAIGLALDVPPLTLTATHVGEIAGSNGSGYAFDTRALPEDVRAFALERDLALCTRLLLILTQDPAALRLEVPLEDRRITALADAALGVQVTAGCQGTLRIRASSLDVPLPSADPLTLPSLLASTYDLARHQATRVSWADRVEDLLAAKLRDPPAMTEIAHQLHLDVRTLRRRLRDEGTSYRELLDGRREARARELLGAGRNVTAVAAELGFHDAATFSRAFRRWSSHRPGQLVGVDRTD
ncbi:AraC family transcriptional regulator [Paraconexibacter algicola]|nr:AraC family transcriptional regulator [Paraconexibacter algicola]